MTLVRILDRMERDGLIERRPDPADRRARRLYLQAAARPVLKEIWRVSDRARAQCFSRMPVADREQLFSLMQQMQANLEALMPGATDGAAAVRVGSRTPVKKPRSPAKAAVSAAARARTQPSAAKA